MESNKKIKILYTNWKGDTHVRNIFPKKIIFTSNKWHKEEQWCLLALDLDKKEERTFACKDIKAWFVQ